MTYEQRHLTEISCRYQCPKRASSGRVARDGTRTVLTVLEVLRPDSPEGTPHHFSVRHATRRSAAVIDKATAANRGVDE
jgi:hypothetical protein